MMDTISLMNKALSPDPYYNDFDATFGDRLSAAREKSGMKQTELADRLGVKLRTIQSWEDDKSEPRANKIQMVSALLNVPMVWLISGLGVGIVPEANEHNKNFNIENIGICLHELRSIKEMMALLNTRLESIESRLKNTG